MQPIKKSLEDFLSERGVGTPFSDYMIDKMKMPHGLSQRQKKKLEREVMNANTEYSKKRQDAVDEYNRLVEQGEIVPETRAERTVRVAKYGHPDNASTQAARRMCEKRGIDWRS